MHNILSTVLLLKFISVNKDCIHYAYYEWSRLMYCCKYSYLHNSCRNDTTIYYTLYIFFTLLLFAILVQAYCTCTTTMKEIM